LKEEETFFWGTHTGAELDLLFRKRGKIWRMEFKFTDSPKMTRSMSAALQELELQHLWLIYAGNDTFPLSEKITATGLNSLKSGFEFELVR